MILGAHCSIAGGFPEAAKAGKWIGCDAIQIFSRSPRMLRDTKPITEENARLWRESLDACIERADAPDVLLCIENTAGAGSAIGSKFEQIRAIIDRSKHPDRIATCFDTCHAFAAGYDIRTRPGYENVMAHVDEVLGLDRVAAFHMNDSKGDVRSHVDRHEHIGKGKLKKEAFRFLVNDPRFADRPAVLETPGEDRDFRRNLNVLRSLVA